MELFCLDLIILMVVNSNVWPFSSPRNWLVDFSDTYLMTSAENSVSEPPNLKISCRKIPSVYPRPSYKDRGIGTRDNAPS